MLAQSARDIPDSGMVSTIRTGTDRDGKSNLQTSQTRENGE